MSGTFAGEQLALELMIALSGIALVFAVLLRFGFLALVVMFYTFLSITYFPLTTDMARPYAGASVMLQVGVAALAAYGFYASRGGGTPLRPPAARVSSLIRSQLNQPSRNH
jgi:hypothetical protein